MNIQRDAYGVLNVSILKVFKCLGKTSLLERKTGKLKPTSTLSSILCLDFHCAIVAPLEGLAPEIMEGLYLSNTKQYFIFASFYAMQAMGLQEQLIGLLY